MNLYDAPKELYNHVKKIFFGFFGPLRHTHTLNWHLSVWKPVITLWRLLKTCFSYFHTSKDMITNRYVLHLTDLDQNSQRYAWINVWKFENKCVLMNFFEIWLQNTSNWSKNIIIGTQNDRKNARNSKNIFILMYLQRLLRLNQSSGRVRVVQTRLSEV